MDKLYIVWQYFGQLWFRQWSVGTQTVEQKVIDAWPLSMYMIHVQVRSLLSVELMWPRWVWWLRPESVCSHLNEMQLIMLRSLLPSLSAVCANGTCWHTMHSYCTPLNQICQCLLLLSQPVCHNYTSPIFYRFHWCHSSRFEWEKYIGMPSKGFWFGECNCALNWIKTTFC